jgi:hypothetical protein
MVLETVAMDTFAFAATDRISSSARFLRLRLGVFGIQTLGFTVEKAFSSYRTKRAETRSHLTPNYTSY